MDWDFKENCDRVYETIVNWRTDSSVNLTTYTELISNQQIVDAKRIMIKGSARLFFQV